MRAGSLFSGIGGPEIALGALGVETIWQSEIDEYASRVLAARFSGVPNLGDIRAINNPEEVEVMALGFPCQDISNAGRRAGIGGSRSSLWGEGCRIIAQVKPKLVFIENVSALLSRGLDVVLADLDAIGYSAEWDCIPAAAVGAPHLRDRIWIVAYPDDLEPLNVFTDRPEVERAVGNLYHQPSKFPRAGRMEQGALYERQPVAMRKTKRLNPGSAWVGAELTREHGWWHQRQLIPTPTVADSRNTRNATANRSEGSRGHSGTTLCDFVTMFPTPVARDWKGAGLDGQLGTVAARGLWPTPCADPWSKGGGGGVLQDAVNNRPLWPTPKASASGPDFARMERPRSGGDDLPTAVARQASGPLNPDWVEWLMGFPLGWTDLNEDPVFAPVGGWDDEPFGVPRVAEGVEQRKHRLTCIGNALVPQVMHWVAKRALERLP